MNPAAGLLTLALVTTTVAAVPVPPAGSGQVTRPVEWLADPDPPALDPDRRFAAQRTPNGKLVLTASNGFFDPGIRAEGTSDVKDAADRTIIGPDFATLGHWNIPGTTTRWHLWLTTPGTLFVNTHLTTTAGDAGAKLGYTLAGVSRTLTTRTESDPAKPQGEPLAFEIAAPGWHTLTIRLESLSGKDVGNLHQLVLFGPAAKDSRLLRARWRPAACHARFSSSTVADPVLWVMSTRASPAAAVSSYSPVTTPFGYYGTSFNNDGISSGTANFSLWSYGKGEPTPQDRWSHMLAVGSPGATFGSFGHEGSGVKLRGDWKPFEGSREVTLALRSELARPWVRWFGYYLDPETQRFRLYAAAAKWIGDSKRLPNLNPGAFVEQPGPPDRRRGGDLLRDIHRRGWMLDANNHWHPIDTMSSGPAGEIASKHWTTTDDGWFAMGMGGIPHRPGPGKPIRLDTTGRALPGWLQGKALDDLHRLPATIGPRRVTDITRSSAMVIVPLSDLALAPGEAATLTVFHGPEDCLTFDRDLGYRETGTRFWPNKSAPSPAIDGVNAITLNGLTPGTKTHLRILVESPRGRIWTFETDSFSTGP